MLALTFERVAEVDDIAATPINCALVPGVPMGTLISTPEVVCPLLTPTVVGVVDALVVPLRLLLLPLLVLALLLLPVPPPPEPPPHATRETRRIAAAKERYTVIDPR